tara:strand:- start:729 stop:896 length:168 start_codon:yes stop_codon:yes gene_type:complete
VNSNENLFIKSSNKPKRPLLVTPASSYEEQMFREKERFSKYINAIKQILEVSNEK